MSIENNSLKVCGKCRNELHVSKFYPQTRRNGKISTRSMYMDCYRLKVKDKYVKKGYNMLSIIKRESLRRAGKYSTKKGMKLNGNSNTTQTNRVD